MLHIINGKYAKYIIYKLNNAPAYGLIQYGTFSTSVYIYLLLADQFIWVTYLHIEGQFNNISEQWYFKLELKQ